MDTFGRHEITRLRRGSPAVNESDELAAEEPLEIRLEGKSLAVVMRTPGHDRELVAGFLVTEGLIRSRGEIFDLTACDLPPKTGGAGNAIDILLTHPDTIDFARFTRHVFSSSSCGICGKATIEAVQRQFPPFSGKVTIAAEALLGLPEKLAGAQPIFQRTGGLHASALFDESGALLVLREDVGRHNALDKVIGDALFRDLLPLDRHILLVSGRVSFEIMQKALAAGIGIVAAISAPTTLAVDFAKVSGQTLIGFLRNDTLNIYHGRERVM